MIRRRSASAKALSDIDPLLGEADIRVAPRRQTIEDEPGEVLFVGFFIRASPNERSDMSTQAPAKPWEAHSGDAPLHVAMTFQDDALVLGVGTRLGLAKRSLLLRKHGDEAFDETRVATLLTATYGRAITRSEISHIRGALEKQSEGQTQLALTHIALANLPKLDPPAEAAWRLAAADALMKRGMAPKALLEALGLGPLPQEAIERAYDPNQPRVPAGNGRPSGRWTNGGSGDASVTNDPASSTSAADEAAHEAPRGVQIAHASDDFFQYINPIGSAQAAQSGGPAFNGIGPNAQHDAAVVHAMELYQAHGFILVSKGAVAVTVPGFATPRVYDFVVFDPDAGRYIGVEVKTTMYDTIFFNSSQVDKDVALYEAGGARAVALPITITRVAYEAFCAYCPMVNFARASLYLRLRAAGLRVRAYQYPGQGEVP